jgi:hypothetical protein
VSLTCWLDAIVYIRNFPIRSHNVGANIVAGAVDSLITPKILKPVHYRCNELGAVHKPRESATVRSALTYPEI